VKLLFFIALGLLIGMASSNAQEGDSLLAKRQKHTTKLTKKVREKDPLPKPPDEIFELVQYPTKIGKMAAYLSKPKDSAKKHPAIIWITGGFPSGGGGSSLWESTSTENEQSARIYRLRGIVMMFPSLRGGAADNPGHQEQFYGEVDDVISAYDYVSNLTHVDSKRVYLGGHSTGGTLALLVAASTDKFAGILSLGPTADDYGKDGVPYEWTAKEQLLRRPIAHLDSIKTPTFVVEGEHGNSDSLTKLKKANKNPHVTVIQVDQGDHYNVIHPVNTIIAQAMNDSKDGSLALNKNELRLSYIEEAKRKRETTDLETLTRYRGEGMDLNEIVTVTFYAFSRDEAACKKAAEDATKSAFDVIGPEQHKDSDGDPYFSVKLNKRLNLTKLQSLFDASKAASEIARLRDLQYDGWTAK